jgi:hypothetical protein
MKAQALVPALALAAALLASPLAEAGSRHRSERGRRSPAYGYSDHRPSYGYRNGYGNGYGSSYGYRNRPRRPYYRSQRYYAPPPAYYGYAYGYGRYGYGGNNAYGYGYYPPPPPRYCPPRPRVGFWFGF